ncbi:MAG: DDE-type integrase/transposase/recombinase [Candidatus Aenigmarchaeota archaeon]|nr:DDE-type integrase/transposase/recombinase [Candidatus Aenigmarchaeota archaeon]
MVGHQISPQEAKGQLKYKNASEQMRVVRGYAIISKGDTPKQINKETYEVPSQSGNGVYTITKNGSWKCTCPDFDARQKDCKHIHAVKLSVELKERVRRDNLKFEEKEKPNCAYCKSPDIFKRGVRYCKDRAKQRYECNKCGKSFIEEKDFQKMKGNAKVTTLMLDLYFKGISYRKISDHLKQFYDLEINASNIIRRIQKYSKIINDYVRTLKPEVSDLWRTDEMKIQAGGKWKWLWNVMDNDTKYMITQKVTDKRRIWDSVKVLNEAKEKAQREPAFLITDGCVPYIESIKRTLGSTNHIRLTSIRDKRTNNNVMERLNGTIRERLKVMRGLQDRESAEVMTSAFVNYYNHIKIHSVLGTTPAIKAGIKMELEGNRWLSLLKKSFD